VARRPCEGRLHDDVVVERIGDTASKATTPAAGRHGDMATGARVPEARRAARKGRRTTSRTGGCRDDGTGQLGRWFAPYAPPPPEMVQALGAAGDPARTRAFFGVFGSTVPVAEFLGG
jgi:hypothetical protein